jgi:hypothetical protein
VSSRTGDSRIKRARRMTHGSRESAAQGAVGHWSGRVAEKVGWARRVTVGPLRLGLFYSFLFYFFSFHFSNFKFEYGSCYEFTIGQMFNFISTV